MKQISLKNIDQTIWWDKIKNGLSVYMLPNKNVDHYYITFTTKYGSVDTEFKIDGKDYKVSDGIAHFLEHVNFNYSDNVTANDLFKKYGSDINAYTTYDHTSYLVSSSNSFKKNLNLLLDYVQKSFFTESLIEKEKGIIVEEVRRYKNDLFNKLKFESNKALYFNNKRNVRIVGEEEDVKGITLDEVKLVHSTFYNPSNMFVVITGNFNVKEALDVIKANQNNKRFVEVNFEKVHRKEPVKVKERKMVIKEEMVNIPKAIVSYKMSRDLFKDYDDEELDNYFYIILNNNFSSNSKLYEELKEKKMISRMGASATIYDDVVIINITIESERINEVISIIESKMKELEMDEAGLVRKRRVNIANLINQYDDVEYINLDIIRSLVRYNKIYDNLYEIYNSANLKKAKDVIRKMNLDNESVVIMER